MPASVIVSPVTTPPDTVAVAVAVVPDVGAAIETVGADVYPVPPAVTVSTVTVVPLNDPNSCVQSRSRSVSYTHLTLPTIYSV